MQLDARASARGSNDTGGHARHFIGVVVVTYNSAEVLHELLSSVEQHEPQAEVVVVDSASPTGAPAVGSGQLVALADNKGYGHAANVGADWLLEHHPDLEAIAFLNPDVRMTDASLSQLTHRLGQRERLGIVTGALVSSRGQRIPSAWGEESAMRRFWYGTGWEARKTRALAGKFLRTHGSMTSARSLTTDEMPVEGFVRGGTMVVRPACWQDIDGFDEDFFMFGEDMDLCRRARMAGWEIGVLPCTPFVLDDRGSSDDADDEERFQWYVDGARRYAAKHLDARTARRLERALWLGRRIGRRG